MEFYEYKTMYNVGRGVSQRARKLSVEEFYDYTITEKLHSELKRLKFLTPLQRASTSNMYITAVTERRWYQLMRPYYKVWPSMLDTLSRLDLNIPLNQLQLERGHVICVRLPKGKGAPEPNGAYLEAVTGGILSFHDSDEAELFLTAQYLAPSGGEAYVGAAHVAVNDRTLESVIQRQEGEMTDPLYGENAQYFRPVKDFDYYRPFRILLTTLLLRNDPTFVTPEVLSADAEKYAKTKDPKYIDKAKRRGVVGWSIGKEFEMTPHTRRPHLGLRWTGKGRTVAKIVPIKGSVIHPKRLTQVPTGYILPNDAEIEETE